MGELVALIVDKYDGSLKAEHGTGRNMAPYVASEWGSLPHSSSRNGAMLRPVPCSALSEPSYCDDHLDELLHEGVVALEVLGLGEVRSQHEVEVPAEAWPATPVRKPCSPSSACSSPRDSAIRSGGTQTSSTISAVPGGALADQPVQALADAPGELDLLGVAGELGGLDHGRPVEQPPARRLARASSARVVGAELDEQRRRR